MAPALPQDVRRIVDWAGASYTIVGFKTKRELESCVDSEGEIGHPDAEKKASYGGALRARLAE
jgi:hypothetical protein